MTCWPAAFTTPPPLWLRKACPDTVLVPDARYGSYSSSVAAVGGSNFGGGGGDMHPEIHRIAQNEAVFITGFIIPSFDS